jgi:hypothetical protein
MFVRERQQNSYKAKHNRTMVVQYYCNVRSCNCTVLYGCAILLYCTIVQLYCIVWLCNTTIGRLYSTVVLHNHTIQYNWTIVQYSSIAQPYSDILLKYTWQPVYASSAWQIYLKTNVLCIKGKSTFRGHIYLFYLFNWSNIAQPNSIIALHNHTIQ